MKKDDLGIAKTNLSKELNILINTHAKYLNHLEKYAVFVKKKIDNKHLYFLTEKLATMLSIL